MSNVNSELVWLERRNPPATTAVRERILAVIDVALVSRHKMPWAALLGMSGFLVAAFEAIESAGIDPRARGETLDVADFAVIASRQQVG